LPLASDGGTDSRKQFIDSSGAKLLEEEICCTYLWEEINLFVVPGAYISDDEVERGS